MTVTSLRILAIKKERHDATDHKPLIRIFNDRDLDTIENPRIRNLKEKSLQFQFEVKYIEGGLNCTADWSSRNPIKIGQTRGKIFVRKHVLPAPSSSKTSQHR